MTPNAKLRDVIFRLGLTQSEVATRAGMNRTILSAIIRGRVNPRPDEQVRIAHAIGVAIPDIFARESEPSEVLR